jgi:hypothetical protein
MKRTLQVMATGMMLLGATVFGAGQAERTWTGIISDSHCGAIHKSDIEHGGRITARECIIGREGDASIPGCVSQKNGAKFVFVTGEKVYQVSNQEFAGLRVHAADNVKLTGTLAGDTITVTKILTAPR